MESCSKGADLGSENGEGIGGVVGKSPGPPDWFEANGDAGGVGWSKDGGGVLGSLNLGGSGGAASVKGGISITCASSRPASLVSNSDAGGGDEIGAAGISNGSSSGGLIFAGGGSAS